MFKFKRELSIFAFLCCFHTLVVAESNQVQQLLDTFQIPSFNKTIYIDQNIKTSCKTYNLQKRNCQNGQYEAVSNLQQATLKAKPGTLFLIREGDYKEALHITISGNEKAYIGYVAYKNEAVSIINANSIDNGEVYGPIWLDNSSYNLISGIDVKNSVGFGRLLNAHHNIINNAQFIESTFWKGGKGKSKRGGLYIAFSHFNKVTNSFFYKGTDSLSLVHSDHNLIANNVMELAGHDIWNIKCGRFNVIKGNEFSNKNQKIGAVLDCESGTMSWHGNGKFAQQKAVVDRSQHNLIEQNVFRDATRYYSTSGGNGIQYAGQKGIIRFNQFYRTNAGIGMTSYGSEAQYNYDNRIYHNTFYDNWCVGISVGRELKKHQDNQFINNILWNNQGLASSDCQANNAKQLLFNPSSVHSWFINNNIGSSNGTQVVGVWGRDKDYSIEEYKDNFSGIEFEGNIASVPLFFDAMNDNFSLADSSPMIDRGAFLTQVISKSGRGKKLQVSDASFFSDGNLIDGLLGDLIQIEKGTKVARIISIDYQSNSLLLDSELIWAEGDFISLSYKGKAPDIGAFEQN